MDSLKRVALSSQYGKQVLQRLRVRPSTAISLDEPHLDSAPLPEVPAVALSTPVIYEEQQCPAAYPGLPEYEQHGQFALPEMLFTPQFQNSDSRVAAFLEVDGMSGVEEAAYVK